ncbi:beta-ribofuranosylaminobenzene 5'-phosphate synthase family protein [Rhizobium sp.]|uniref:beta-ribofuranosylaminobenzene 5'-phosphate synthase family protein n=1 Tax=Rhizobium sp. TaxID=391 RepID=UPI0028A7E677
MPISTDCGTKVSNIQIDIFPRIHVGLISMHADAIRSNGGIGFSMEAPLATVSIRAADSLKIIDRRLAGMTDFETSKIVAALERACRQLCLARNVEILIDGCMRTHFGMGSGTAIRMACIEGLLIHNGVDASDDLIQRLSGRGGTSGVGINAYLSGGLHLDLGVRTDGVHSFRPSSIVGNPALPLPVKRTDLPSWPMGIYLPPKCMPKTQEEEIEFFRAHAPIAEHYSQEAAYIALFGVLGSALEGDYEGFCKSIDKMQTTEWKRLEIAQYGEPLREAALWLRSKGADCVGMSSFGPLLYFFASPEALVDMERNSHDLGGEMFITAARNTGRRVIRSC